MTADTFEGLREKALDNLWFASQQWNDMAEEDGMRIISEGKGVKVKDVNGKWYYDAISGQGLVNVGHGRQEISAAIQKTAGTPSTTPEQ